MSTGNALLALLGGIGAGVGQARERKTQEAYKKAQVDQIKTMAKLHEQHINLEYLKAQQGQLENAWLAGGGVGPMPTVPMPPPPPGMVAPGGQPSGAPMGGAIPPTSESGGLPQIIAATQAATGKVGYQMGAKDSSSGAIDCSGWVSEQLGNIGIPVTGTAADMAKQAASVGALTDDPRNIRPGSLIFTSGQDHANGRFGSIGHTGLVVQIGNNLFVSESKSGTGPTLTPLENYTSRGKVYNAPLTAYAQGQGQAQPAPQPQAMPTAQQGGKKTPIDIKNPFVQIYLHKKFGYVPKGPRMEIKVGEDGNWYTFEDNKVTGMIPGPGKVDWIDSVDPNTGQPMKIAQPRPTTTGGAQPPIAMMPVGPTAKQKGAQEGEQQKATNDVVGLLPDVAGRANLINMARKRLAEATQLIILPDGSINEDIIKKGALPGGGIGQSRILYSKMYQAIEAALRIETGAQANPNEIKTKVMVFWPSVMDLQHPQAVREKMKDFTEYINGAAELSKGADKPMPASQGSQRSGKPAQRTRTYNPATGGFE